MQVIGIIAEYNPFHTGHAYQIQESRRMVCPDSAVVAVMSGNWVQQANCAIADKWLRARLALEGGADLVLELPTLWATASAEGFARGAVELLDACGVVDWLSFGSECGSVEPLVQIAASRGSSSGVAGRCCAGGHSTTQWSLAARRRQTLPPPRPTLPCLQLSPPPSFAWI